MENKGGCGCSTNSIVRSKGEYLILVKRYTFHLNVSLPYCIWGAIYLNPNSFATILQPYLPAGITVTTSVSPDGGLTFSYTDGDVSDRITVSASPDGLLSYSEMLSNLRTNYLKSEVMYFCNNSDVTSDQVLSYQNNRICQNEPLYMQKIGGIGDKKNEYINPFSRRSFNNSVPDVIEIALRKQDVMPDTVWIHKFAYISQGGSFETLQFSFLVIINESADMNKEHARESVLS